MIEGSDMMKFIEEAFEENYELLRLEGGHALSPHVKNLALEQVKHYWKKFKETAENVSDTEVKLTLPLQMTPEGVTYSIQGIVDVVEENEKLVMYDIKTHDVDYVRENIKDYEGQLNIYAYIWQAVRGQQLDRASIIATGETDSLKKAKRRAQQMEDEKVIDEAVDKWEPEVPIELAPDHINYYLQVFGEVVDSIENLEFSPPNVERLKANVQKNKTFADHACNNCDVRFSCESYKEYAISSSRKRRKFNEFFNDFGSEQERIDLLEANLEEEG